MKVAILGTVPNSRRVAPYKDESWEIWVCSPGNGQGACPERVTRWFELHALVDMVGEENKAWCPQYFAWLAAQTFPVYMQERNEYVPQAIPFPRKPLLDRWGANDVRTNWFTSSIAWMIAYALHLGAKEIGIFGVDMAATEEHYSWQKAGCLRFFEIAREMGVKIVVPLESTLAQRFPIYGYAEASRHGRATIIREMEIKQRIAALDQQKHASEMEAAFFRGALEQISFERRTWVDGQDDAEIEEDEGVQHIDNFVDMQPEGPPPSETQFEQHGGLLVPKAGFEPPKLDAPGPDDFPTSGNAALLKKKSKNLKHLEEKAMKWPESTDNGEVPVAVADYTRA
jgi:hypothetical protein